MVIIVKVLIPPTSATEVGKRFPEMPTIPDFITRRGPYVSSKTKDGIVIISIFEFDNSRAAEAMNSVGNYYAFSLDIPGYTYSIEMFFEVQEALKMIGLE